MDGLKRHRLHSFGGRRRKCVATFFCNQEVLARFTTQRNFSNWSYASDHSNRMLRIWWPPRSDRRPYGARSTSKECAGVVRCDVNVMWCECDGERACLLCRITKKGLCNALKALGGAWATTPESHRRICSSPAGLKTRGCELPEEDGFCIQNACLNANLHKTTQPGRALIMRL